MNPICGTKLPAHEFPEYSPEHSPEYLPEYSPEDSSLYAAFHSTNDPANCLEHFCGICHDLAAKPVEIKNKIYCLKCVKDWYKTFNSYPGVSTQEKVFPRTIPCNNGTTPMTFRCDYRVNRFNAILTKSQFDSHIKSCPFIPTDICRQRKGPSLKQDYNELKAKLNSLTEEVIGLKKEVQELKNKEKNVKKKTQKTGETVRW